MSHKPFDKTVEMLRYAFGDNLQDEDYLPLLYVLFHDAGMGYRSLAEAITDFFDGKYDIVIKRHKIESPQYLTRHMVYAVVLGDTYYVDSSYRPRAEQIQEIKAKLEVCDYSEWLKED